MSPIGDSATSIESTIAIIVVGNLSDLATKKEKFGFFSFNYEDSLHKGHVF